LYEKSCFLQTTFALIFLQQIITKPKVFALIFLRQTITKQHFKYLKAAQSAFVQKTVDILLVKLTPGCPLNCPCTRRRSRKWRIGVCSAFAGKCEEMPIVRNLYNNPVVKATITAS